MYQRIYKRLNRVFFSPFFADKLLHCLFSDTAFVVTISYYSSKLQLTFYNRESDVVTRLLVYRGLLVLNYRLHRETGETWTN